MSDLPPRNFFLQDSYCIAKINVLLKNKYGKETQRLHKEEYIKASRNVYIDITVSDGHSLHRTLFSTIKVGKYMIKSCLK